MVLSADLRLRLNSTKPINGSVSLATEDSKSCWCGEFSIEMVVFVCLLDKARHLACVITDLRSDWMDL